jgi:hypothetical protein
MSNYIVLELQDVRLELKEGLWYLCGNRQTGTLASLRGIYERSTQK